MDKNNGYKILVVDDTPELLVITLLALKKAKYEVVSAANGTECMDVLQSEKPDIILLDVMLPDVNGKDLAKTIKNDPRFSSVFIILLSSLKTSSDSISEGLDVGADGYIVRPIESRELLARVAAACRIVNAERQNAIQNEELKKLNAEKDLFLSILAHDLKGSFNNLLGYSELLIENIQTYDLKKIETQVKIIHQSSNNAYNLLDDLLSWSNAQSGKISCLPQKLDFSAVCDEVIQSVQSMAMVKNISITYPTGDEHLVYADANMLKSILRNLISNAIKFSRIGGSIAVAVQPPDGSHSINSSQIISVSDNGTGIDALVLPKLFDISQSFTTIGTQGEKGTGLGLLLCKEFVAKHGGRIWVESKVEAGSTFFFSLPVNI